MTFVVPQDDLHELPHSIWGRSTQQLGQGHGTASIRNGAACQDPTYENIRLHRNNADSELRPKDSDRPPSTRNGARP